MNVMDFEPQDALKHRPLANLDADDREELVKSMEKVFVLPREVIYWPSRPIDQGRRYGRDWSSRRRRARRDIRDIGLPGQWTVHDENRRASPGNCVENES